LQRATTIVEMTVAMAILAVVFATIMPVFAAVRNHADTAGANSEMVQNARVLNEQLYRHLAGARRIIAMSGSTASDGYVEFEAGGGAVQRCQRGSSGWVEFGAPSNLSELAGPVQSLKFVCYDGNDPAVRTDVPGHVRLVTWEARLASAGTLAGDKTIHGACYLRISPDVGGKVVNAPYDFSPGHRDVDCFAFAGEDKPVVPRSSDIPSSPLDTGQYDAIEVQDGVFHEIIASDESDYLETRFVFQIKENRGDVTRIAATWRGKGVNEHKSRTDGASLYLWNYALAGYELLEASADTEAEVTLSGFRTDAPMSYIGGANDNTVVLLAVSNDKKTGQKSNALSTDYVRLDITAEFTAVLP
jgi:hypothetical protein